MKTPIEIMQDLMKRRKFSRPLFYVVLCEIQRQGLHEELGYTRLEDYLEKEFQVSLEQINSSPSINENDQILNPIFRKRQQ